MSDISLASSVIDKIKDEVESYIIEKKKDILSNVVVALSIAKLEDIENEEDRKALMDNNNYFCIKANKKYNDPLIIGTSKYKRFANLQDGIEAICNTLTGIKGLVSVDVAINNLSIPDKMKTRLTEIIESYLKTPDTKVVDSIITNNTIEVEDTKNTEQIVESTIPSSKKDEKQPIKFRLSDSANNDTKRKAMADRVRRVVPKNPNRVKLVKANLYDSPTAGAPSRIIDGCYFLTFTKPINGRLPVVMKPEFIGNGNMTMGWVNKNEVVFIDR